MRKLVAHAAVGLMLIVPCATSAQVFFGARLGYSIPNGYFHDDSKIGDTVTGTVPVQLDLGFDIAKAVALGVYGSAGYSLIKGNVVFGSCGTGDVKCTGLNLRAGGQATLHALVGQSKVWGGALVGWEEQRFKASVTNGSGDFLECSFRGVEAGLQGGVDFPTSGTFRWGPFVSASVGEFQSASIKTSSPLLPLQPITEKKRHTWLALGLRGVFGL